MVGNVPQMLLSNCRHGVFHESALKTGEELTFHDVHGVSFAKARSGQRQCIDVHGDLTTVFGDDGGPHDRGHLAEEVSNFSTEEAFVRVLRFVAEDIHNLSDCGVVSYAG